MNNEYQERLTRAHHCDISERYEDMAAEMKKAIMIAYEKKIEMTVSTRNSFSLAYKNLVSQRRSSWRVLYSEKQKLEEKNSAEIYIVNEYLAKVEKELIGYCDEVLDIIDNYILKDNDVKPLAHEIFFLKMKGDYYRYKAEVLNNSENKSTYKGDDKKHVIQMALESYEKAVDKAVQLSPTDPIRLGLYLNFSVFNYEILNDIEKACSIAKLAFESAISDLDTLSEDYYKDSTLIMQLLRDNLTLWKSRDDSNHLKEDNAAELA